MKKKLLTSLALCLGIGLSARAQSSGQWGIELGRQNALSYRKSLSPHLTIEGRAGLFVEWDSRFDGLVPIAELMPKWHITKDESGSAYRSGGYFGLGLSFEGNSWTLFASDEKKLLDRLQQSYALVPTLGWNVDLSATSYLHLSVGVGFVWSRYESFTGKSFWLKPFEAKKFPLVLGIGYGIRI